MSYNNRNQSVSQYVPSKKKIAFFSAWIISIVIIVGLVQSIWNLWHKQDLLSSAQRELVLERKQNAFLEKELKRIQSPQFLEEQARNKLFLGKEGEKTVVIPKEMLKNATSSGNVQNQEIQNWQQWLDLFFGSKK